MDEGRPRPAPALWGGRVTVGGPTGVLTFLLVRVSRPLLLGGGDVHTPSAAAAAGRPPLPGY